MRFESLGDHVGVGTERQVANEECFAWRVLGVAECLAAVVLFLSIRRSRVGEVDVHSATVKLRTSFGLMSFSSIGSMGELHVTKSGCVSACDK